MINDLINMCFDLLENNNFAKDPNTKEHLFSVMQVITTKYRECMGNMFINLTTKVIAILY